MNPKPMTLSHRNERARLGGFLVPFRSGTCRVLVLAALMITAAPAVPVEANQVAEVALVSGKTYANPLTDAQLDAVVTQPDGTQLRVPGFWAGGTDWRFRYASGKLGSHNWRTECTDTANSGLHGMTGSITVTASTSTHLLFQHGPIRVAGDKRHFEHADGTPFLWLGDTWWKGLCKRLTWEGFQELTADRKTKGFSVVQIVCGPYPDENFFAPSWENEGGQPYLAKDMSVINPKYFEYNWDGPEVKDLEPDVDWHVYYFDPASGRKFDQGTIKATATAGDAAAKPVSFQKNVPSPQDWVLVFEREKH